MQETLRRLQEEGEQEAGEEVSPAEGNTGMSDNPFIIDTPSGMPTVPDEYLRFDIVDDEPMIAGTMG